VIFSMLSNWLTTQLASMPWAMLAVLFVLALLFSAVGFYRVVYFISIGYAFSIVAMAVTVMVLLFRDLTWASALHNILLIIWGLRLGIYLLRRELQSSYGKAMADVHQRTAAMPFSRRALIWVGVSLLYVMMFSPSLFRLMPAGAPIGWLATVSQVVGLLLMVVGLVLEGFADRQKSDFKAHFPKLFCNVGLYRSVRCPNYLGEITFWAGNFVVGLAFYATALRFGVSFIGVLCIVLIMMGSTKRLEESQDRRYGALPDYQTYVKTVPVLFPFVPIYSLKNTRVFLE
jgi:steroid 5-alpha reductase family enzyme